jgi:hypothetical protein
LDKLLALLTQLTPLVTSFVPKAESEADLLAIIARMTKFIHDQGGMTTDDILEHAGKTLDDNEKKLMADKIRLAGGAP